MTMSSADWEVLSDGPERFEDGTLPFLDIVALRHGGACCWGDGAYLLAGLLWTCLWMGLLPAGAREPRFGWSARAAGLRSQCALVCMWWQDGVGWRLGVRR